MYRVAIIDGDDVLCTFLEHELVSAGCRVSLAHDGASALALLQSETFDLVLMGIVLSGLSGLEILEKIRKDPRTEQEAVMIMSMIGSDDVIQKALHLGVVEYIVKPQHMTIEIAEKALHFLRQGGRPSISRLHAGVAS